jgi:hypothetical protein
MHLTRDIHHPPRTPSAAQLLGHGDPLTRAEERMPWLRRQAVAVAGLLAASALAVVAGADVRGALVAGALVLAALVGALLSTIGTMRERARQLIAEGREGLPLDAVRRQRARLANPRYAAGLARSIDRLRADARRPGRSRAFVRPLYAPAVVREVDAELEEVSGLLRAGAPPTAVARAEQLLTDGESPLYDVDPQRLREELRRIEFAA